MTDFPIDTVIFNKIVEVFNQTRSYVLLLFPLAFFIRIAFGFIFLKGPESFIDILKDSLFLFLGLFFFTDILKLTLQIPYFVSKELSFGEWRNINLSEGIFTKFIKRIVDWIGILSYWISFGLYVVIISILGFLAGYILFLGTMFRAYGMLKVFFLLLFMVSLWPLLWHSINFAVFTVAVSDNALANNVIVGGASLAKVILPLWLISKTSKIPIAQTLSKVSFSTGSLAGAAGASGVGAYSVLKDRAYNFFHKEEIEDEEGAGDKKDIAIEEANITQESFGMDSPIPYPTKTYIEEEPEDFSIREASPEAIEQYDKEILKERGNNQITAKETETKENLKESHIAITDNKETHTQSETINEKTKELHANNSSQASLTSNSQVIQEIKESSPVSETQSFSESILNEPKALEHESALSVPDNQKTSLKFNENIHRENWIEEEEKGRESNLSHRNKEEKNNL